MRTLTNAGRGLYIRDALLACRETRNAPTPALLWASHENHDVKARTGFCLSTYLDLYALWWPPSTFKGLVNRIISGKLPSHPLAGPCGHRMPGFLLSRVFFILVWGSMVSRASYHCPWGSMSLRALSAPRRGSMPSGALRSRPLPEFPCPRPAGS